MNVNENGNIEITLKTQNEEEEVIDFGALGRHFSKMRGTAALLVVAALILGMAAGAIMSFITAGKEVSTLVTFGFEGIESGVDPNGAIFDITKISAPAVVEPALEAVGLRDVVRPDQVRQNMSYQGVIPEDALERISVVQTMAEKETEALEDLLAISYHPVEYVITLDLADLDLSKKDGIKLLDAINTEYRNWFLKTYSHESALGIAIGDVDSAAYDYTEAADLYRTQVQTAQRYVGSLQSKAPTFRSTETGLTFADLSSELSSLLNIEVSKLNALVLENLMTTNENSLNSYYRYQIRMTENSLAEAEEQLQAVNSAIAGYEKSTAVIYSGDSAGPTSVTNESAAYDGLFAQQVDASNKVAALRTRLTELQQNYTTLTNRNTNLPQWDAESLVNELLDAIPGRLSTLVEKINTTAQEYYETVAYLNAFTVEVPAQANSIGLMTLVKNCAMCAGVLVFVACVAIAVMTVISSTSAGDMYRTGRKDREKKEVSPAVGEM